MSSPRSSLFAACALAALVPGAALAQVGSDIVCEGGSVCRDRATQLQFRILTRPFATLYESAEATPATAKESNLSAFKPYYVFARQDVDLSDPIAPKGWYQVGVSETEPLGWIEAKDALEWRQALVAAYEPLGSGDDTRTRVLGFNSIDDVRAIAESADPETEYETTLQAVSENAPPANVITAEPEVFLDIDDQFYLFPILDWELNEGYYDDPLRFLQLASAVAGSRAETPEEFTTQNPTFLAESAGSISVLEQGVNVDVVFVMDTTNSMADFITFTKEAIQTIRTALEDEVSVIRFGFVGYRDSSQLMPEMVYTTNNYTPTLVNNTQLGNLLDNEIQVVQAPSGDYQEEVFAGMKTALESQWSDNGAVRLIVLVGDASSHPSNHRQNTTGLDEAGIRRLADEQNARVVAVHLKDEEDSADWAAAERQFKVMGRNKGLTEAAYFEVNARERDEYFETARSVAELLSTLAGRGPAAASAFLQANADTSVSAAPTTATNTNADAPPPSSDTGGSESAGRDPSLAAAAPPPAAPSEAVANAPTSAANNTQRAVAAIVADAAANVTPPTTDAGRRALDAVSRIAESALIDYLGSTAQPPRDVTFWVSDLDLTDPRKKTIDVRVLITKKDLDDVVRSLEQVGAALKENKVTNVGFMKALQGIVTLTSSGRSGVTFDDARMLADTRLLPSWISSLPYKSKIMNLTDQQIAGLTPDEVLKLIDSIDAQITLYKAIIEDANAWEQLNETDSDLQRVHPMPLALLP